MKRRQFLAGTVPTASVVLGGCLGSGPSCSGEGNWPPNVQVDELELAPGDSDTFEIQVDGITAFSFDSRLYKCGSTDAPVRFGDIDFTPSTDSQADSYPPFYVWDDCTRVTLRLSSGTCSIVVRRGNTLRPAALSVVYDILDRRLG